MSQIEHDLLSIPCVVLGLISLFCNVYTCIAVIHSGYCPCVCVCYRTNKHREITLQSKPHQHSRKLDLNNIIFWMCLTDFFQCIQIILNWLPLTFNLQFWDNDVCKELGIYAQFFAIQSPLLHMLLAYNLGYLILNRSVHSADQLYKQRYYQYILVIIIPILSCIIPIIISSINVYGAYSNNNSFDKECWFVDKYYQSTFAVAVLLSLTFEWIVLLTLCFKWRFAAKTVSLIKYNSVISRLSRFVVVYTLIRFLPALERLWGICLTNNSSPPFWLILSHHICISSVGIANGIAWSINQRDPETKLPRKKTVTHSSMMRNNNKKKKKKNRNLDDDTITFFSSVTET